MSTEAQEAKARILKRKLEKGQLKFKTKSFNRCSITGRSRGFIRRFGLCRNKFRELALKGLIPGVRKASW